MTVPRPASAHAREPTRWFAESQTWTGDDYLWLNRFRELYRALAVVEQERDQLREAVRIAEGSLHSWAILNTHTDPRESQRLGQRALERFRAAVPSSEPAGEPPHA